MYNRRWLSWVVSIICSTLLIGCEAVPQEHSNIAVKNKPVSTEFKPDLGDRSISQDITADVAYERISFKSAIKDLSINQKSQGNSSNIVSLLIRFQIILLPTPYT